MNRRLKIFVTLILILVAGLLGYAILSGAKHSGLIKVSVHTLPSDASVSLDGKHSGDTLYLKPGIYSFSATKDGFSADTQKINISTSLHDVYLIPGAVSDAAKKYQQDPKIQNLIQEYSGKIFGSASQEVSQKYPLVAMLPHLDLDFRIDYGKGVRSKDTVSSTAIYIRAFSPAARREAISWIRQQGYDPSDYEIVFSNFTNPFSSGASQ